MAFSGKVDHHIETVFGKKAINEGTIANVAFHEKAAFVVDVLRYGAKIAGISEKVEHDNAHVVVLFQDILQVVGADESGSTCD